MTSHKFQSFSEQQWKSGTPRSRCAECAEDFGHPAHCESSWRFILVVEGYDPEYAAEVIKLTGESEIETGYTVIHVLAVYEEMNLRGWRLN